MAERSTPSKRKSKRIRRHGACHAMWHRHNGTCQRSPKTLFCIWCDGGYKSAFRERDTHGNDKGTKEGN